MYLQMIFRDGFYHADPHPGNYMLLPGGVVGVLDCGMVGRIDDDLREEIESLLLAVISRDAQELTNVITRICQAPSGLDRDMLRMEIGDFCSEYVSQSLQEFDFTGAINQLTEIIRGAIDLSCRRAAPLLLKTLVMLEGISRQLSPDFNLAELLALPERKSCNGVCRRPHWCVSCNGPSETGIVCWPNCLATCPISSGGSAAARSR